MTFDFCHLRLSPRRRNLTDFGHGPETVLAHTLPTVVGSSLQRPGVGPV